MKKQFDHLYSRRKDKGILISALVLFCSFSSTPAYAEDLWWEDTAATGVWFTDNWSTTPGVNEFHVEPVAGDNAYLFNSTAIDKEVLYYNTAHPTTINLNTLEVNATGSGSMTLSMESFDHTLSAWDALIGWGGTGNVVQSTGTFEARNDLRLGLYGGTGIYSLSGGALTTRLTVVGSNEGVGGSGIFNQSGGTHDALYLDIGTGGIDQSGAYSLSGGVLTTAQLAIGLGADSSGELIVTNGADVINSSAGIYLGSFDSSATGKLTVDGLGSSLDNSGLFYIGWYGQGEFTISNRANVSSDSVKLGVLSSGSGTAVVDGVGSSWNISNTLDIGRTGDGDLNISNGANVSSGDANIGSFTGATGTATVSGGSSWNVSGYLSVGNEGDGSLTISNGGSVLADVGYLGQNGTGTGTAIVDGVGSIWTNSALTAVGYSGSGDLEISNGGTVSSGQTWIASIGGSSSVVVGGAGSSLTNTDGVYVGGTSGASGGTGVLTVNSGASVVAGSALIGGTAFHIWGSGTVNLNGGSITTDTFSNQGTFNFNAGTFDIGSDLLVDTNGPLGSSLTLSSLKTLVIGGTTSLTGIGTLTLDGGTFSTGSLIDNGGFAFNKGTFNLTNDDLTIGFGGLFGSVLTLTQNQAVNVTNNLTVDAGALAYLNNGTLTGGNITNNGQVLLDGPLSTLGGGTLTNNDLISGVGEVSATLVNNAAGEVRAVAGDALQFTGAGNTNAGDINLLGGTVEFTQDVTNNAGGRVTGNGTLIVGTMSNLGTLQFSANTNVLGDINNDTGGVVIVSGGSTVTFFDEVTHNGTEIRVSSSATAVYFDLVSGPGSFTGTGLNFFEGGYSPGSSPGLVEFEADVGFGAGNTLFIELAGLIMGDEYDALDVGGTATLDGILNVDLLDGFLPSVGDTFDILMAATILGEFSGLALPSIQGIQWQLATLFDVGGGSTDMLQLSAVQAVPVPGAVWLLGSALAMLGWMRRRHRGIAAGEG